MSKLGVGVGDDFPVDDGSGQDSGSNPAPGDDRAEFEQWKRERDAHRAGREQYRAQKDEWRQRKRAFKDKVREAARECFGEDWEAYLHERHTSRHRFAWPFSFGRHYFAGHGHHHGRRGRDFDSQPAPQNPTSPPQDGAQ